ncbi:exported protein of unknown function [Streptomyces murinus]
MSRRTARRAPRRPAPTPARDRSVHASAPAGPAPGRADPAAPRWCTAPPHAPRPPRIGRRPARPAHAAGPPRASGAAPGTPGSARARRAAHSARSPTRGRGRSAAPPYCAPPGRAPARTAARNWHWCAAGRARRHGARGRQGWTPHCGAWRTVLGTGAGTSEDRKGRGGAAPSGGPPLSRTTTGGRALAPQVDIATRREVPGLRNHAPEASKPPDHCPPHAHRPRRPGTVAPGAAPALGDPYSHLGSSWGLLKHSTSVTTVTPNPV